MLPIAKKLDSKEIVTIEKLAHRNYFQIETMFKLLVKKRCYHKEGLYRRDAGVKAVDGSQRRKKLITLYPWYNSCRYGCK